MNRNIGPGAEIIIQRLKKRNVLIDENKSGRQLTPEEFAILAEEYDRWELKPRVGAHINQKLHADVGLVPDE